MAAKRRPNAINLDTMRLVYVVPGIAPPVGVIMLASITASALAAGLDDAQARGVEPDEKNCLETILAAWADSLR